MIVYGDEAYGEHPLGGAIVQIGTGTPPYPPDEIFVDADAFKIAHPAPVDQNYILYDYADSPPTDDPFWNPYNTDLTYTFTVSQQSDLSIYKKGYNYSYSYSY